MVTNYRTSDDYASSANFDIGSSSLLGFALQLRPSKDGLWTHRPMSSSETGKPWGAHENPGSNCPLERMCVWEVGKDWGRELTVASPGELNMMIATLSTGPVILADKAGDTNATLVHRSVRGDGLILQPDKPATSIDATFTQIFQQPLPGHVWSTYSEVSSHHWHYVLSIDVLERWALHGDQVYPPVSGRVLGRRWHQSHAPRPCRAGQRAVASGCILPPSKTWDILNDRPIMVANDSHHFDLLQLSPVLPNGWILLGELEKYVSVSARRFAEIRVSNGISVELQGVPGEQLRIVALEPTSGKEWIVVESLVRFETSWAQVRFTPQLLV